MSIKYAWKIGGVVFFVISMLLIGCSDEFDRPPRDLNQEDDSRVAVDFAFALAENDSNLLYLLTYSAQHDRLEDWLKSHEERRCLSGFIAGGSGFREFTYDNRYHGSVTIGCRTDRTKFGGCSLDLEVTMEKVLGKWVVADWNILTNEC